MLLKLLFALLVLKTARSSTSEEFIDAIMSKIEHKNSLEDHEDSYELDKSFENTDENSKENENLDIGQNKKNLWGSLSCFTIFGFKFASCGSFWDRMVEEYQDFTKFCLQRKPCKLTEDCPSSRR